MARKTISKKDVLAAIKSEKLVGGHFVDPYDLDNQKCSVCAVGATLRKAGLKNSDIEEFTNLLSSYGPITPQDDELNLFDNSLEDAIKVLIKDKQYLHALSVKFEELANKHGAGLVTRKKLVKFVNENFPARVRLNPEF